MEISPKMMRRNLDIQLNRRTDKLIMNEQLDSICILPTNTTSYIFEPKQESNGVNRNLSEGK